jgi:hypothetical protein
VTFATLQLASLNSLGFAQIERNYLSDDQWMGFMMGFAYGCGSFMLSMGLAWGIAGLRARILPLPPPEKDAYGRPQGDWRFGLVGLQMLMTLAGSIALGLGLFMQYWPFENPVDLPFWQRMAWIGFILVSASPIFSLWSRFGDIT